MKAKKINFDQFIVIIYDTFIANLYVESHAKLFFKL